MNPGATIKDWHRRLMAALLANGSEFYTTLVDERKRGLLGGLSGTVVEIGPGGGPNLRYYAPGVRWIGVEPNPHMHPYLRRAAAAAGLEVDLRAGAAEALPVEDASVDAVVSTLVLCSVHDLSRTLAEVQRVLKPEGVFLFVEHVAAAPGSRLRRVQELIRPVWSLTADGCRPNQETWAALEAAGFAELTLEHFTLPIPIVGPHIAGRARK